MIEEIEAYISSQPEAKRRDMQWLHAHFLQMSPACKLWFLDGKNTDGRVVANPNIGYGCYTIQYADGKTKEFYRVGLSANTTGISVYIRGVADKNYLPETYGKSIGKASVSGYCIKFKGLKEIDVEVLAAAVAFGMAQRL